MAASLRRQVQDHTICTKSCVNGYAYIKLKIPSVGNGFGCIHEMKMAIKFISCDLAHTQNFVTDSAD